MRALECTIARHRKWLDAKHVKELVAAGPITPVPGAASCIRGVMQVRGQIVPVVDGCVALGLGAMAQVASEKLVLVHVGDVFVLLDAGKVKTVENLKGESGPPLDLEAWVESLVRICGGAA